MDRPHWPAMRDLPAHFRNWSMPFRRFIDWRKADVFVKLFETGPNESNEK